MILSLALLIVAAPILMIIGLALFVAFIRLLPVLLFFGVFYALIYGLVMFVRT